MRQQLETLYAEHGEDLLRYLRRQAGIEGEAEDLLHDTFVEAARHADRLRAAVSPRAWLFGVARHVAGGLRRRLRMHRRAEPIHEMAAPAGAIADERLDRLRTALESLRSPYRETLELRLREGLNYAEVAQVLGVPVGTVRSRIHHAIERLREALADGNDSRE